MCLIAVQQEGYTLAFVPEDVKTFKVCIAAVQQNKHALPFVPNNILKILKKKQVTTLNKY